MSQYEDKAGPFGPMMFKTLIIASSLFMSMTPEELEYTSLYVTTDPGAPGHVDPGVEETARGLLAMLCFFKNLDPAFWEGWVENIEADHANQELGLWYAKFKALLADAPARNPDGSLRDVHTQGG